MLFYGENRITNGIKAVFWRSFWTKEKLAGKRVWLLRDDCGGKGWGMTEEKTEEIGKIKLDLTYYPGEDLYCDGDVENELLEIARNYSAVEFPGIIEERKRW